jgi:hypothetical protein
MGISLQARKRSLKTEIRARLSMKRKAKRTLSGWQPILVRDASDERYPYRDTGKTKSVVERGKWKVYMSAGCEHDGVHLTKHRYFAFVDDDGKHWDYAECMDDGVLPDHTDPWHEDDNKDLDAARLEAMKIWDQLPEASKAWFEVELVLPYENILDIDEEGDEFLRHPHVYVSNFTPLLPGPFRPNLSLNLETIASWGPRRIRADKNFRVKKFARE